LRHLDLRRQPVYCVHQSSGPLCQPPPGLLDCTPGHPSLRQPVRPSEGPALPSWAVRRPRGTGGSPRGCQGPSRGCWPRGRVGASRAGACSGASCPVGLVGGGWTRDDRRRPGHRAGEVYGRAGVDGGCGWHGHTPMGPWGQVYVCPELAATLSEQGKTQGYAISEGACVSEQGKTQGKAITRGLDREGGMFYSRRTRSEGNSAGERGIPLAVRKQRSGLAPLASSIPSGLREFRSMGRYCGKCGREVQAVIYAGEAVSPAPVYRCPHCGPRLSGTSWGSRRSNPRGMT
jgi:DNA-directed RNA polymerase subunit RPC12/RpoP